MAFPEVSSVLDDFDRANENPLAGGAGWLQPAFAAGALQISTNVVASVVAGVGAAYLTTPMNSPDGDFFVVIPTLPAATDYVELYARLRNPGEAGADGYAVRFTLSAGTDTVTIHRIDNGVFTQLATANQDFAAADSLGISLRGSRIAGYRRAGAGAWSEIVAANDLSYAQAGYVGMGIRNTLARVNNFTGGGFLGSSGDSLFSNVGNQAIAAYRRKNPLS